MKKNIAQIKPQLFFLITSLIFGILICIITPYGSANDEYTHTVRTWEISKFDFIPNKGSGPTSLPAAFLASTYRSRFFIDPLSIDDLKDLFQLKIIPEENNTHFTRSFYSPLVYFPAAIVMGLFLRILNNIPVIIPLTLIKLLHLSIYILLTYIAIKKIPFGKFTLATISLAPIVILESSIVSIEYINYGSVALFISWVLFLANKEDQVNIKEFIILLFLIFLITIIKTNSIFLLLFLFIIPKYQFSKPKWKLFSFLFAIISLIVFYLFWNIIAYSNFYVQSENINLGKQVFYILGHPTIFIQTLFNQIAGDWKMYIIGWIGLYGYGNGIVPIVVYWLYIITIIFVSIFDTPPKKRVLFFRMFFFIMSIVGVILTFTIFYLTMNNVGDSFITGIQGRYFYVSGFLFFFGLVGIIRWNNSCFPKILSFLNIFTLCFYTFGLFATYYILCGTNLYTKGLCYLPQYKNWDPVTYTTGILSGDFILKQTFISKCNGLSEVRIMLAEDSSISGELIFKLIDRESKETIATKSIQPEVRNLGTWINMQLDYPISSLGKSYILSIQPFNTFANNFIFSTAQRDEYRDGDLIINGKFPDTDVLFQYGCITNYSK